MNPESESAKPGSLPLDKLVHDLLQSLRAISLSTQRIQRMPDVAPELAPHLETIALAVRRQEELLHGVSEVELATRETSERDVAVPLRIAIQGACQRVDAFRATQDGRIDLGGVPDLLVPSRISKAVEKVLHNSLKFHRDGIPPQVHVQAHQEGLTKPTIVLRISDNGIGIPADHRERVFQPFCRLNPAAAYPGSALGLAISRMVVESMHGMIGFVDTESGVGVTVEIRVPVAVM